MLQFVQPLIELSLLVGGRSIHHFLFGGGSGEELLYCIE
jgi:hypothetical protein